MLSRNGVRWEEENNILRCLVIASVFANAQVFGGPGGYYMLE